MVKPPGPNHHYLCVMELQWPITGQTYVQSYLVKVWERILLVFTEQMVIAQR